MGNGIVWILHKLHNDLTIMLTKFIISTFGFNPSIGGLTVLHKLSHMLNEHGYESYLAHSRDFGIDHASSNVPFVTSPRYNTKLVTDEVLDNINDYVIIYPESWVGNYLGGNKVVRWILSPPEQHKVVTWSDDDLWFWYSTMYSSTSLNSNKYTKDADNHLTVEEFYRDIFRNNPHIQRDINSWTLRKATNKVNSSDFIHDHDSVFISYEAAGDMVWLNEIFNRSNKFYSYDTYTFLNVQALMCGADSIVVPSQNLSHDEFINYGKYNKFIAYGLSDLERAKNERIEFDDFIQSQETESINQLHLFVEKCNDYFKTKG